MIAETLVIASLAISPNLPVAIIWCFLPPTVTSDSIGNNIPEANVSPPPITARPLTRPIRSPVVIITSYSFLRSTYLSAICCSNGRASFNASWTCFLVANSAFSSLAKSPAARTRPPRPRRCKVKWPLRLALLLAWSIMALRPSSSK